MRVGCLFGSSWEVSVQLSYPVPANSPITQTFADHIAVAKRNGWAWTPGAPGNRWYYGGIDWAAAKGTPVTSAADGVVIEVRKDDTGYGWHVRVRHGEHVAIYAHLSAIAVKVGQQVTAGQMIGAVGSTGNSTGPHLHFELRDARGIPIDPMPLLVGEPPTEQPGQVTVSPGFRMRQSPGGPILGYCDGGQAERIGSDGDWVKLAVWVHKSGVR